MTTFSCKSTTDTPEIPIETTDGETYFSIIGYMKDQYEFLKGQPYVFDKIVTLDGQKDSTQVGIMDIEWAEVIKPFADADISNPKFLGKYDFDQFVDNELEVGNIMYTAKDKNEFMQRMNITYNIYSNKVESIYIETLKGNRMYTQEQKLTYMVGQQITINNYEKSIGSKARMLEVKYIFK